MREHFKAMKDRVSAAAVLAGKVHDSALVDAEGNTLPVYEPYAILFGGGPDELGDDRLTAPQLPDSDAEFEYTLRSVGSTPDEARAVASVGFAQLVGHVLVVDGRKCERIRHVGASPVDTDSAVKPPLYFCDDDYAVKSSRA